MHHQVAARPGRVREPSTKSLSVRSNRNVKNGIGGLRDYQNLLWIANVAEGLNTTAKIVERKFLRSTERHALEKAYDFLLRVRTEMHYLNGRAFGRPYPLQLQGRVANRLPLPAEAHPAALRGFHARLLQPHARHRPDHWRRQLSRLSPEAEPLPPKGGAGLFNLSTRKVKLGEVRRIPVAEGWPDLSGSRARRFNEDPFRLLRVFQHMQDRASSTSSPELAG